LAAELVNTKPDVLVAGFGTLPAKAAKAATSTIPIVFASVGDPVGAQLINSLSRPELKAAATETAHPIQVFEARNADQVVTGVDTAAKGGAAGLITLEDALLASTRRQIAERAITTRLPIVYGSRAFPEAGGLISYGVDRRQMYRRAAEYVDMILKGRKPAELPVEQPTKFELVINLKAAKAIGLEVPDKLLALADEVIESRG
jgi:putative ABC transport system substrate-binding protein